MHCFDLSVAARRTAAGEIQAAGERMALLLKHGGIRVTITLVTKPRGPHPVRTYVIESHRPRCHVIGATLRMARLAGISRHTRGVQAVAPGSQLGAATEVPQQHRHQSQQ